MRALVAVCLVLSASAALAQGKQQPGAQSPPYVGRWYSGNVKECKGVRGGTDGLLVYTPKEFYGMESTCRITSTQPKGNAIEMVLRCRAEGETSTERESVSVSGNKLTRHVTEGGKRMSFTYTRCP